MKTVVYSHETLFLADGATKNKILGSMFSNKFEIEPGEVRTNKWLPINEDILLINKNLDKDENKKVGKNTDFSILLPLQTKDAAIIR